MNVTIKHYEGDHHEWNTESLWQCICAEGPHGDDLCSAFNILHQVAYDTVFKDQDFFPDTIDKGTTDHINQLSFVGVTTVPGSRSQVRFTFSHTTFLEFLAALHLTTLPLNDQLAFTAANAGYYMSPHLKFYLGLIGDIFYYNTSGASAILKQYLYRPYFEFFGLCFAYNKTEELVGWTPQQFGRAIDLVFKTNYSMCACQCFFLWLDINEFKSEIIAQGAGKLALKLEHSSSCSRKVVFHTSKFYLHLQPA